MVTPENTNAGRFDATARVVCTVENDQKKVKAVLNEIHGMTHDGKPGAGVPAVFGMNFQAVSVGQKLASDNKDGSCAADTGALKMKPGGYKDGAGTPTDVLAYGLHKTDETLRSLVKTLKRQRLYESTLFM